MPEDTVFDPTNKGTLCPNAKPLQKKGDAFQPMQLPDFGWEITLPENASPDDPITLFTLYYTPEIIDLIVEKTNKYVRNLKTILALVHEQMSGIRHAAGRYISTLLCVYI
jgi:hypothetical protein